MHVRLRNGAYQLHFAELRSAQIQADQERVWASVVYSSVISAVFVLAILLFKEPLVGAFMPEGESSDLALQSGMQFIAIVAPFVFVVNVKIDADAVVRGCNGTVGFMVSTFSDLVLRVGLVFLLTRYWALRASAGLGRSAG